LIFKFFANAIDPSLNWFWRLNINQPGPAQVVSNGDSKGKVPVKTEHDEQHFRIAPAARGMVLPSKPTALPMRRRSRDDRGVTLIEGVSLEFAKEESIDSFQFSAV
jgi:hypothetical protein